jgi:hypothetical protein
MRVPFRLLASISLPAFLLSTIATVASAQTSVVYYYPSPGVYSTTAGPVWVPAAGYYTNVPRAVAPGNSIQSVRSVAPRSVLYSSPYTTRANYRPMGSTPYFEGGGSHGTPHYLHGRGYDSRGHN